MKEERILANSGILHDLAAQHLLQSCWTNRFEKELDQLGPALLRISKTCEPVILKKILQILQEFLNSI
jgi:hypothetical protein